ncbi:MAG: helix-turn-helix domain-containing protein [Solirubrobacteraceae bacterium]|jgi:DNA-binding PucR family transcriptional regulator
MAAVQPDLEVVVRQQVAAVLHSLQPSALAEEMADVLLDSIPELGRATDQDFRASLVLSCESNLSAIWGQLLAGPVPESITPPPGAIAWAQELVHRGVELPALLRAYRLGHWLAERRFVEVGVELELDPDIRWRALAHASEHFFAYIDAVCTTLVEDYELEHARWIRGAAAARAELVGAILERRPIDPRAATDKLRYDVTRRHVAMIVWSDPREETQDAGSLETEALQLAAALGGGPVLTVPIGERVLWAWTWGEQLVDDAGAISQRMGAGVRAAIGNCGDGLAGMADSHEQARIARRLAELREVRSGTVVAYRTGGLTALLAADPAEAVRFAEAELGDLVAGTDVAARLRATLRAYLEENLSPARASRRLGIHQNTVVYRVKRAEELLGHEIEPRRLQLEIALRVAEMFEGLRAASSRRR